jgi:hypothetical protein
MAKKTKLTGQDLTWAQEDLAEAELAFSVFGIDAENWALELISLQAMDPEAIVDGTDYTVESATANVWESLPASADGLANLAGGQIEPAGIEISAVAFRR